MVHSKGWQSQHLAPGGQIEQRCHYMMWLECAVLVPPELPNMKEQVPTRLSMCWLLQIASVISSFTIGPERVAAAALLFTRAADSHSQLHQLTQGMSSHDLMEWKHTMGGYAGYCWNQPTGEIPK
jgi:hypothetical protein